jgi:Uma2 family endonuclease
MPITRSITSARELIAAGDLGRCELLHGELFMMTPAGSEHGRIAMTLGSMLAHHARAHRLGAVYAADTGFLIRRDPDTVRAPDAAFVRAQRLTDLPSRGYFNGAPDLAIEVLSPDDRPDYVRGKVEDWLSSGCIQVWVVDPARRCVTIHITGAPPATHGHEAMLDGGSILPGFQVPVQELFQ